MPDSAAGYGELARDHLARPVGAGCFSPGVTGVVSGEAGSLAGGGFVRLHLQIRNHRIIDTRFEVYGGPALMAAGSWYCAALRSKKVSRNSIPSGFEAARLLGLPRDEQGSALLAEDAVLAALEQLLR